MSRAPSLLETGALIGGRYQIEGFLAEGGMAKVYRALHTGTHRMVALKVVHPQLASRSQIVEKFLDEARLAGKIPPHPNIVQVFDSGSDEITGAPFIAMELVKGQLLDEHMGEVPLPWREANTLLTQLADALGEAHAHQIVHRDLKPSNLIVTTDRAGKPLLKVLDFGIAKVLGDGAAATATQIGTPVFCAPEQLGATMRKVALLRGFTIDVGVSPATDVWAFALLAYQMLTGYAPGQYWRVNEMSALMAKIALEDRVPAAVTAGGRALHLPYGFDDWFLCCLKHSAAERFQQIGEAMAVLSTLLQNDPSLLAAAAAESDRGTQGSTLRMAVPRISEGGLRTPPEEQDRRTDELPLPDPPAEPAPPAARALAAAERVAGPARPAAVIAKTEEQGPAQLSTAASAKLAAPAAPEQGGPHSWRPSPGGYTTRDIPQLDEPPSLIAASGSWPRAGATPYAAWLSGRPTPDTTRHAVVAMSAIGTLMLVATMLAWWASRDSAATLQVVPLTLKTHSTVAIPAARTVPVDSVNTAAAAASTRPLPSGSPVAASNQATASSSPDAGTPPAPAAARRRDPIWDFR